MFSLWLLLDLKRTPKRWWMKGCSVIVAVRKKVGSSNARFLYAEKTRLRRGICSRRYPTNLFYWLLWVKPLSCLRKMTLFFLVLQTQWRQRQIKLEQTSNWCQNGVFPWALEIWGYQLFVSFLIDWVVPDSQDFARVASNFFRRFVHLQKREIAIINYKNYKNYIIIILHILSTSIFICLMIYTKSKEI